MVFLDLPFLLRRPPCLVCLPLLLLPQEGVVHPLECRTNLMEHRLDRVFVTPEAPIMDRPNRPGSELADLFEVLPDPHHLNRPYLCMQVLLNMEAFLHQ